MPQHVSSAMKTLDRPMLLWRVVGGAFLHFTLPAYVLLGLGYCAAGLLSGLTFAELAAHALTYSAWFATGYLALALSGTAAAVLLDPPLRRRQRRRAERNPNAATQQSYQELADALAEGRARLDAAAVSQLDAIAAQEWHHEQLAFQALSADLTKVVRTSIAAMATASSDRREDITAVTVAALSRIADGLHDLQMERSRLDEGDLRTVARYIDGRYLPSNSAGDSVY